MRVLTLRLLTLDRDEVSAQLWELGTSGVIESHDEVRAFFTDDTSVTALSEAFPQAGLEHQPDDRTAIAEFDQSNWEPALIGERFIVAPSWLAVDVPPGRTRLTIDAVDCFGSGRHESTQLVIQAMEEHLRPKHRVLDVGCGSGILGEVAHHLGAERVIACDIHEGAIRSARRQVKSPLFVGSADALRPSSFDVTIANISARVIDAIAYDLNRVTSLDGRILLAGFVGNQTPETFVPLQTYRQNDWVCYVCRPECVRKRRRPVHIHSQEWW